MNVSRQRRAAGTVLALVTLVASGCATDDLGAAQDTVEAPSTSAPQASDEQVTREPAVQAPTAAPPGEAPQPSAPADTTDGQAARTGLTAAAVIDALRYASLDVGEVQDQTVSACAGDVGCVALITTDYVDVYEWQTEPHAQQNLTVGEGQETVRLGRVVLQFGTNSGVWPFDTAPYVRVAREALRRAE